MSVKSTRFKPGDPVVFRKTKHGPSPGPRAQDVFPEPHGEEYVYTVDKYWVVAEVADGRLRLLTRTGKEHWVACDDPQLRRPSWWERLWYSAKFPDLEAARQERAANTPGA